MPLRHSRGIRVSVVVLALALAVVVAGCGATADKVDKAADPVSSVDALLTLRYERSTDASEYAKYLAAPELATELAKASAEESTGAPPTPEWEQPYESSSASSTAEVVVIWKPSKTVEGFPPATVFSLKKIGEVWKSTDAVAVETTAEIPARKK